MYTSLSKILTVVLIVSMTHVLDAQETERVQIIEVPDQTRNSTGEVPDLTGVWEVVYEDGGTTRLELVQRGDSLYGYIASSTPISGVVDIDGGIELSTLDSMIVSNTLGDTVRTFVVKDPNSIDFKGRIEPYSTSTIERYATSIKGTMFVMDKDSGDILIHKPFSAAKRFDKNLPSWMKTRVETIPRHIDKPSR